MLGYNLGSTFGFEHVPAGIGGLIIGTQPLLIALLAALIARERLTPATILGLIVAFIGTGLLFWNDLAKAAEGSPLLWGGFLIFMSGVAWAVYVVLAKPLIQTYGAYPVSAISIALATLPMLFMASADTLATVKSMSWARLGQHVLSRRHLHPDRHHHLEFRRQPPALGRRRRLPLSGAGHRGHRRRPDA